MILTNNIFEKGMGKFHFILILLYLKFQVIILLVMDNTIKIKLLFFILNAMLLKIFIFKLSHIYLEKTSF